MTNEGNSKNLSQLQKIGYGLGDAGSNFCWSFIGSFIMIYCTNTLGVSAAVIGTLMMLSKALDGITDVFMGRIIDVTHSKMGKARFWYFVSTFPVSLFTFFLFNVPGTFSESTKYVYIFITYTLLGAVFYTMNNIAYSTLTALCTKNPKDRVEMGSYRFISAVASFVFQTFFTSRMVEHFGGGQKGWFAVSLIYSILCFVFLMIPVIAVRELPESELEGGPAEEKEEKTGFFQSIKVLLSNKYFLMILGLYLVEYLYEGIVGGMGVYFATYQLGDAGLFGVLSMAGMLPIAFVLPFVSRLTTKYGIRKAAMAGHVIGLAGAGLALISGLTGNFVLTLIGLILVAVGRSPHLGGLNALIAETAEYSYLKFGKRQTGTIYSCSSVGIKVGSGIGTAMCGFLLELGGFDGMAAMQTATAISTINWSYLLTIVAFPVLSLLIFSFMKVETENKKMRENKQ